MKTVLNNAKLGTKMSIVRNSKLISDVYYSSEIYFQSFFFFFRIPPNQYFETNCTGTNIV